MEVLGLVSNSWEEDCHVPAWGAGSRVMAHFSSFLHVLYQPVGPNSKELSNPNGLALCVAREGTINPSFPATQLAYLSTACNPAACRAVGRGLQPKGVRVKETADFKVYTKGAGSGELKVTVKGPSKFVWWGGG